MGKPLLKKKSIMAFLDIGNCIIDQYISEGMPVVVTQLGHLKDGRKRVRYESHEDLLSQWFIDRIKKKLGS